MIYDMIFDNIAAVLIFAATDVLMRYGAASSQRCVATRNVELDLECGLGYLVISTDAECDGDDCDSVEKPVSSTWSIAATLFRGIQDTVRDAIVFWQDVYNNIKESTQLAYSPASAGEALYQQDDDDELIQLVVVEGHVLQEQQLASRREAQSATVAALETQKALLESQVQERLEALSIVQDSALSRHCDGGKLTLADLCEGVRGQLPREQSGLTDGEAFAYDVGVVAVCFKMISLKESEYDYSDDEDDDSDCNEFIRKMLEQLEDVDMEECSSVSSANNEEPHDRHADINDRRDDIVKELERLEALSCANNDIRRKPRRCRRALNW